MRTLDPRTHLAVLTCAAVWWFLYEQLWQIHGLCLLGACYLWQARELRSAVRFCVFYIVMQAAANVFALHGALLYIILHTFARSIPLMMFAAAIAKCNPSRLMTGWQKIGIPKTVLIMLCMMMRFFPVLQKEMAAIKDGIKARGIFPHWYDYLCRPVTAYESFFVPLTVRCLKLSAELGATAELRGLDAPQKRSCMYDVRFSLYDALTLGTYGAAIFVFYYKI